MLICYCEASISIISKQVTQCGQNAVYNTQRIHLITYNEKQNAKQKQLNINNKIIIFHFKTNIYLRASSILLHNYFIIISIGKYALFLNNWDKKFPITSI